MKTHDTTSYPESKKARLVRLLGMDSKPVADAMVETFAQNLGRTLLHKNKTNAQHRCLQRLLVAMSEEL